MLQRETLSQDWGCAVWHIEGGSGKHLAVSGLHLGSVEAWWEERER